MLVNFYRCTTRNLLTNCISVWYGNCTTADKIAIQRVVKTSQQIIGTTNIQDTCHKRCIGREKKHYQGLITPKPQSLYPPAIRQVLQKYLLLFHIKYQSKVWTHFSMCPNFWLVLYTQTHTHTHLQIHTNIHIQKHTHTQIHTKRYTYTSKTQVGLVGCPNLD